MLFDQVKDRWDKYIYKTPSKNDPGNLWHLTIWRKKYKTITWLANLCEIQPHGKYLQRIIKTVSVEKYKDYDTSPFWQLIGQHGICVIAGASEEAQGSDCRDKHRGNFF